MIDDIIWYHSRGQISKMRESDLIEKVAELLYKQAGYGNDYLLQWPNRAWSKLKDTAKEKWYWRAREILNLIEQMKLRG